MEKAREYVKKSSSSKISVRCPLLKDLWEALRLKESIEGAVKPLIKTLGSTLLLYNDGQSIKLVHETLKALCETYEGSAVAELSTVLKELSLIFKGSESISLSRYALTALSWSVIALKATPPSPSDSVLSALVASQVMFVAQLSTNTKSKLFGKAVKQLNRYWNSSEENLRRTLEVILLQSSPSPQSLPLVNLIAGFCQSRDRLCTLWKEKKVQVINYYIKAVLSSRTKPPEHLVTNCSSLFGGMSHDEFSSTLLSPATKCLLRNPDELIDAVACLVSNLHLDCSRYAMDFVKTSSSLLCSSSEVVRSSTVKLVGNLSHQSSDPEVCVSVCQYLVDMLLGKGSGGKIAVVEHRGAILNAVGKITSSSLTTRGQEQLATTAIEGLLAYLKLEAHSGTQVTVVRTVSSYCRLFSTTPPQSIVTHLKTVLESKTIPPQLRIEYWNCVDQLSRGDNTGILSKFTLMAAQSVEKVKPSSQSHVLEEALVVSWVLVSRAVSHPDTVSGTVTKIWPVLNSGVLANEKIVQSPLSTQSLTILVKLTKTLLLSSLPTLSLTNSKPWLLVLVQLVSSQPWPIQRVALECLQHVAESAPECSFIVLDQLYQLMEGPTLPDAEHPDRLYKAVLRALFSVSSPVFEEEMKERFAVKTFLLCHFPELSSLCRDGPWLHLLKLISLPPASVIPHLPDLIAILMSNTRTHSHVCHSAVSTLLKVGRREVGGVITERIVSVLGNDEVLRTTEEDLEIATTPPDMLWSPQLQQLLADSLLNKAERNMKRETKAYSYEDQVWEAKLKEEMAKKKLQDKDKTDLRAQLQQAKLSQKQRQTIEDQLEYETSVRERVARSTSELEAVQSLLNAILACEDAVLPHIPNMVTAIINGMYSHLSSKYCKEMWEGLCRAALPDKRIALLLCWISVRVLHPNLEAPPPWSSLPLIPTLSTLFSSLPVSSGINGDVVCSLSLPLVSCVLKEKREESGESVGVALQTLSSLCKVHTTVEEFGHSLFPVVEVISLLSKVIASQDTPLKTIKAKKVTVEGFMSLINTISDTDELTPPLIDELVKMVSDQDALLRQTGLRGWEVLGGKILLPLPNVMAALMVTCNDMTSENSILSNRLWQSAGYSESDPALHSVLVRLLTDPPDGYQSLFDPTATALGKWLEHQSGEGVALRDELIEAYKGKTKAPPPSTDEFGRTISTEYQDPWEGRVGVAKGYAQLPKYLSAKETMELMKEIIPMGISDKSPVVRAAMTEAAQAAIAEHGETLSAELMIHFEVCLSNLGSSQVDDLVRQAVVVLMGSLAKHMDKEDQKVKSVIGMLLSHLDTPSQQVQQAISACLVPLASSIKAEGDQVVKNLLNKLLDSTVYSERRGAAYGLAGIVKGLGIPSLKQYEIMATLQDSIKDKKNYRHREGALFAFQALCDMLGKLFEPYVVTLLPDLLLCFGDGNQYVREATDQASKTIMAHLSSHGVKLILPSLLTALEQDNWRTKAGSAELLGTMAHCAPKQLSTCLPSIVPRLMEVLTDSHSKVQQAGNQALREIGSVIKNPEVQKLVPVLLDALGNPSGKTQTCLHALLNTEFEHRIDPPSLALIIPIIKRALDLRSAESKKMAAQTIANIYNVTEKKDLGPYLGEVLPGLKQSITDPLPEVRSSCAKALGAMVQGVGEEELSKVLPWLLKTLQSEATPVDRSGAAQGISEVLKAQDIRQLQKLMPRFIDSAQNMSSPAHCRDGFLMLFVHLPQTFGDQFLPFVDQLLPPILKGLADESEFIRDTSILAAQTIIASYADKSLDLFLPQLEKGLLDDNWRIRCSSVQLLGDLLFSISGQSGKMTTESAEDDNFASEELYQVIVRALGVERRNRVLAGLYMGRSDVAMPVRQNSLHVWKLVVTNTARTLREILPTLISILLTCLACDSYDKRQVAAQTLGDLVRKLGERVLPEVIPMLEKGLKSDSFEERQGVCIGLSEIIKETSREYMQLYANTLLPTIRAALCDRERDVRAAAAQTFDSLFAAVGQRVLEEILTPLVDKLQSSADDEERMLVLDGLQQIMAVRSNVVLPMIIPHLIQPPVNIKALALLSSVAGHALYKHLPRVIPALVTSLVQNKGNEETLDMAVKVVSCVQEEPGVSIMFEELFKFSTNASYKKRHASMLLIEALCNGGHSNLSEHLPQLVIFVTEALSDSNEEVCQTACNALEALVSKVIGPKELPTYIGFLHKALKTCKRRMNEETDPNTEEQDRELHGFALKGIMPVLTVLKEGLVSGSQDNKEEGARVLILVINLSSAKTLTSGRVVMMIAGPLIRVLGDKYGWQVKVAVLEALVALVRKVGSGVKGFIPQLQSSYLKALNDPNSPVRNQAVTGIAELMRLSPRVDPVFNELHNNIKKNEDSSLRNSFLQALSGVLVSAGQKMTNNKYKEDIKDTLIKLQDTAHEGNRHEAAKCLGILCTCLLDDQLVDTVENNLARTSTTSDWGVLQAKGLTLLSAMQHDADRLSSVSLQEQIQSAITEYVSSDRIPVCVTGLQCVSVFVNKFGSTPPHMIAAIKESFSHPSVDVRQAACDSVGAVLNPSDPLLQDIVPLLLVSAQEKNTAIKAAAEGALLELFKEPDRLKHCISSVLDSGCGRRLEECYSRLLNKKIKA